MHAHSASSEPQAIRKALAITSVFALLEILGGLISNSLALISDGVHMIADAGALCLSLFVFWLSRRPAHLKMSFGYHRAETLGALINGLLIWVIAGQLIYEALLRIKNPPHIQGGTVLIIACIGLLANLWSMKILHSQQKTSLNIRAAYLHLLSDALGSISAIIAGAVLWWKQWPLIDPVMTLIFSGLMFFSAWNLLKESIHILMQATPQHINPEHILQSLETLTDVQNVHDLHIWTGPHGKPTLSVHVCTLNPQVVFQAAHHLLQQQFGIQHITVQMETMDQARLCSGCSNTSK